MSIRNLDSLYRPSSIAVIGASKRPGSVGAVLARNLLRSGFDGPVMPVNPHHEAIEGVLAYPDVASLPRRPDLAVIATPPETVPQIVAELGERGTRAAVVISAGFGELGERGKELERALLVTARPHTLRIVGPNCLGILVPDIGLNASFAQVAPRPGHLAFVTQSGAVVTSVLDWAAPRGIGFSHLVSLGDMVDVDFGDMLDYLANDAKTRAVLLYMEGVTQARKFLSAARAASRMKPVMVVKSGRFAESARAAASHTGALAGSDRVYDAAFRRAGMLRVHNLEDLFAAVETLAMTRGPVGERLAILTNGGGMGVLATDVLIEEGGQLAELPATTLSALDELLPATWSRGNPVDIIGDAGADRYGGALRVLLDSDGVDAVLVLYCPTAVSSPVEAARAVIDVAGERPRAAIFTSWVGDATVESARRLFSEARLPSYGTPERAVRAYMETVSYRRSQESLLETPPSVPEEFTPETERARAVIAAALDGGRSWLSLVDAAEVLAAYGIPSAAMRFAPTPEGAAAATTELGGPVALKIVSPELTHKTDVGGVALDLAGAEAVLTAARGMADHFAEAAPDARLEGFAVQTMVHRPGAFELILGASVDPQFGPVLLFGHGGTGVEVLRDSAVGLPPLNMRLAHKIISRTRVGRLLGGYRGRAAVDRDAVAMALIRLAQLVIELPEVQEVDVNPLLADAGGVLAVDARIRVAPASGTGADRLAIRPYPKELEETIRLGDGRKLLLRPIRPEDEPSLHAAFAKLTPEEIRLRFLSPLKTMTHMMAARFTQLDYDREMALVLTDPGIAGKTEIYGVVRLSSDPDNERAEYAIIVRHDMTGMGLGVLLMRRIIDYARRRGLRELWGEVLRENSIMRKLCRALGFEERYERDDPSLVRMTLDLRRETTSLPGRSEPATG
jgi:acetyltransferase